jgi:hypothetical protein
VKHAGSGDMSSYSAIETYDKTVDGKNYIVSVQQLSENLWQALIMDNLGNILKSQGDFMGKSEAKYWIDDVLESQCVRDPFEEADNYPDDAGVTWTQESAPLDRDYTVTPDNVESIKAILITNAAKSVGEWLETPNGHSIMSSILRYDVLPDSQGNGFALYSSAPVSVVKQTEPPLLLQDGINTFEEAKKIAEALVGQDNNMYIDQIKNASQDNVGDIVENKENGFAEPQGDSADDDGLYDKPASYNDPLINEDYAPHNGGGIADWEGIV